MNAVFKIAFLTLLTQPSHASICRNQFDDSAASEPTTITRSAEEDLISQETVTPGHARNNVERLQSKLRAIHQWRRFNGERERASILARDEMMSRLNHYLSLRNTRDVVNLLGQIFEDVEISVRMLGKLNSDMQAGTYTPAVFSMLESEKLRYEKQLGLNISNYLHFRNFLLRVADPNQRTRNGGTYTDTYREAAATALARLGIESSEQRQALQTLGLNTRRPSLRQVQQAYQNSELAIETKLQRDLNSERVTGLQTLFSELFFAREIRGLGQRTFAWVAERSATVGRIFASLNREARNHRSRLIDLNHIRRVILLQGTAEQKLNELRALYNSNPDGTLLSSFSRIQEVRAQWNELKALAEAQRAQDAHAQAFYEAIVQAEELGVIYGEISEYHPATPVAQIARWIALGILSPIAYHEVGAQTWPLWTQIDSFFRLIGLGG